MIELWVDDWPEVINFYFHIVIDGRPGRVLSDHPQSSGP